MLQVMYCTFDCLCDKLTRRCIMLITESGSHTELDAQFEGRVANVEKVLLLPTADEWGREVWVATYCLNRTCWY